MFKLEKGLAVVVVVSTFAFTASAQTDSSEIAISLLGQVPKMCAIAAPAGQVELNANTNDFGGNLAIAHTKIVPVPMSCNAPFKVSMQSSKGALVNSGIMGSAFTIQEGSFTRSVPYALSWSVALDNGQVGQVSNCASAALVNAPGCELTTSYSAINKVMQTSISWAASSAPLLVGNFQDTITIKLSAVDW